MLKHWRDLWRRGLFWPLLWLTIRHPRTQKYLWTGPPGYRIKIQLRWPV